MCPFVHEASRAFLFIVLYKATDVFPREARPYGDLRLRELASDNAFKVFRQMGSVMLMCHDKANVGQKQDAAEADNKK